MKTIFTTLIIIGFFTAKVGAQSLPQQPKFFGSDTIHKADTSLLSTYLKRNPQLFKAPNKLNLLANTNQLAFYSPMPIAHITASTDHMPIAKLHSDDKMPVKKIEVLDPLKPVLP